MRFVALIEPGRNWESGSTVFHQGGVIADHLAHMAVHYDEGRLMLGGPFADGMSGVAVIKAENETQARSVMDGDPAVVAGVLTYALRTLNPYFDVISGTRRCNTDAVVHS